jgi:nicotinamide riboside kinase
MDIDLPWIPDEQRANPNDRAFLFQKFEDELKKIKANYVIINGTENERFKNAITAIKDYSRRV